MALVLATKSAPCPAIFTKLSALSPSSTTESFLHRQPRLFLTPRQLRCPMRSTAAVLAVSSSERRRSQRSFQVVPLVIRGELESKKVFWEDTFTSNVSVHGALMILSAKVVLGQRLVLMNPQTWQEEDARV